MKKYEKYIDAQLSRYAPLPLGRYEAVRVKLHTESGETNWLCIDAQCAREIEAALYKLADHKDAEADYDEDCSCGRGDESALQWG